LGLRSIERLLITGFHISAEHAESIFEHSCLHRQGPIPARATRIEYVDQPEELLAMVTRGRASVEHPRDAFRS
jgi:hypothetical protein